MSKHIDTTPYAPYGWIITRDCLDDERCVRDGDKAKAERPASNMRAVGMVGPRNLDPVIETMLRDTDEPKGHAFRIRDSDGNLYYEGRALGCRDTDHELAPLDDFGRPNAGASVIEWIRDTGEWTES